MAFDLAEAIALLTRTPALLRVWLADTPDGWLHATEGPDTFSPAEVLGHLLHGEDTDWIPRARRILEDGPARPFEPFDRFAHRRLYGDVPVDLLLERFAGRRAANLETLRTWNLTAASLAREGEHPELGRVTLRQLLATWVVHDLAHLAQIARVMAKQYADEVGPWRAYLRVLEERRKGESEK